LFFIRIKQSNKRMSLINELTNGREQEQFILSCKGLKTKALIPLIRQILSHPGVFVFGEFMYLENVRALKDSDDEECRSFYELLEIFAFGTYDDYKRKNGMIPELSENQMLKLKKLSIVQLASEHRTIPYVLLLEKLDVSTLRELEDLIIECMYQGLVEGKLDQEKHQFQVDQTIGRDIQLNEIDRLVSVLVDWQKKTEMQLEEINEKIQYAIHNHEDEMTRQKVFQAKIEELKTDVKVILESSESEMDPRNLMHMEQMNFMDREPFDRSNRHHKNKKGKGKDRDTRNN